jgi:uncharacterized protein (UPF0335 family)
MSGIGHNSGSEDDTFAVSDEQLGAANVSAEELRLLIERIERLEEEKKGIADDIKDVYSEGKAKGYDTKMMRKIIALRKMDPDARREMEAILATYLAALGMD